MKPNRSELMWVVAWSLLIVAFSSIPYILGWLWTPKGYSFHGLTHNIDDGVVYLSWMRQAADGHFFIRNLFTNEPQAARTFNILFLLMGNFARFTGLSLIAVYHIFRVGLGIAVIFAIWQFSKLFLDDSRARRILVPLVGLSSGIGWLMPRVQMPLTSVDMWQPEAITFLSIYLNPLFCAGLLLMIGAFYYLILADRTGKTRYAAIAGIHLLLLGNIHTYDVITVAAVWAGYLIIKTISERKLPLRISSLSAVAATIAVPSVAYQFYLYSSDPVFQARANSPTPSPAIWSYLEGYGLILAGAIAAFIINRMKQNHDRRPPTADPRLLIAWSIIGFALPYLPIGQQRKLVMGLHVPLCILCAFAISAIAARLPKEIRRLTVFAIVLLTIVGNARFLTTDIKDLRRGTTATGFSAYISQEELAIMRQLRYNKSCCDTVLAPPAFALFVPALAGHQVYYGHWSETPDYKEKIGEWGALADDRISVSDWRSILDVSGARCYVSVGKLGYPPDELIGTILIPRYSAGSVKAFQVRYPER